MMQSIIKSSIIILTLLTPIFADCQTYYADIDGDGNGAKSVWCSWTELSHATGENWEESSWETNGCGTVGWNGSTSAGHLTYGPYISSDPGNTNVTWNLLANGDTNNDGTQIATIDIYDATSGQVVNYQNINVNDFSASMVWQDFTLSYYSTSDHVYEFRTWYTSQGGHLVLRYITHKNVQADTDGAYATSELCDGDDTSGWSLNTNDFFPTCAVDNYSNVDWAGDQNSDGYYGFDGSDIYIDVESYPNIGSATLTVNGADYTMTYADWGSNAHWSYQLPTTANNSYSWSVTVATCGGTSQTVSGTFVTDCANAFNGSDDSCLVTPCDALTDCSGHGTTSDSDNSDGCTCNCDVGWAGSSCDTYVSCEDYPDCSGNGTTADMDNTDGCDCVCDDFYSGSDCDNEYYVFGSCGQMDEVPSSVTNYGSCAIIETSTAGTYDFDNSSTEIWFIVESGSNNTFELNAFGATSVNIIIGSGGGHTVNINHGATVPTVNWNPSDSNTGMYASGNGSYNLIAPPADCTSNDISCSNGTIGGTVGSCFCICNAEYFNIGESCYALTTCTSEQYESTAPTATSDRVCSDLTVCTASEWESTAPTATSDRVCSDNTCVCANGGTPATGYACTSHAANICTACTGEFYLNSVSCDAWATCTADQFESTAPTATSDRVCTALTFCTSEQYESTAPTATSDRVCADLTICDSNATETIPPTATSDRECTCNEGYEGDGSSCTQSCGNGDANASGNVNVTDITYMVIHIVAGTVSSELLCAADMNQSGDLNVTDIILIIQIILNN